MRTLVLAASMLLLSACNDSGSSELKRFTDTQAGMFVDAPVSGMAFRTSFDGQTDGNGEFPYLPGDTVTFELGGYEFAPVPAADIVSVVDLFDSGLVDRRVINLARLLQSLDLNDRTPDLIELPDLDDYDFRGLNFDVDPDEFAADVTARTVVAIVRDDMVSAEDAFAHILISFSELGLSLPDLAAEGDSDGDGIDDLIDADDDNDGVVDLNNGDPLPALENPPERITLPVTDDDGDSSTPTSTGAIENTTEAFRNATTDSDGDGIFDHLDFFPNSTANSFYVDLAGSDVSDCSSPDQACRSIQRAASLAGPGDRIAIQGGDYFESGIEITTDLLTIRGVGRGSTIINGDQGSSAARILTVAPGLRVQISGITFLGGASSLPGSAISAEGGELYLRELGFVQNGNGDLNGSAVEMLDGVLSVQQSDFVDAQGRAIYASNSDLDVNLSGFTGNLGTDIFTTRGNANLTRNTYTGNLGNAIEVGSLSGEVIIENSTFFENAIAITTASDSRIVANHITVRGNIPGALAVNGDNLELNNSYIYRADCSSVLGEGAGNLIDSDTCGSDARFLIDAPTGAIGNDLIPTIEGPAVLVLDSASPAVDAVACLPSVTIDQQGQPRPAGMLCDAGAYELQ